MRIEKNLKSLQKPCRKKRTKVLWIESKWWDKVRVMNNDGGLESGLKVWFSENRKEKKRRSTITNQKP